MPVQGWTPINGTIATTDEYGIHTFDIVQFPLLSPKRDLPPCRCLGHDLQTHKCHE